MGKSYIYTTHWFLQCVFHLKCYIYIIFGHKYSRLCSYYFHSFGVQFQLLKFSNVSTKSMFKIFPKLMLKYGGT